MQLIMNVLLSARGQPRTNKHRHKATHGQKALSRPHPHPCHVIFEDVPLVQFLFLVFTRLPGESYCRRFGFLLLCPLSVQRCQFPLFVDFTPMSDSQTQSYSNTVRGILTTGRTVYTPKSSYRKTSIHIKPLPTSQDKNWYFVVVCFVLLLLS